MPESVEYYLSKGFEPKMADYFAKGRRKITGVIPNDDFSLTLTFDNGEKRIFDTTPLLQAGTIFETFRDINNFRCVYLDENNSVCWDINPDIDSCVYWSNKVDICPDTCYVDSIPLKG